MADISLSFAATENVSDASKRMAAGLGRVETELGKTEAAAKGTARATDQLTKAQDQATRATKAEEDALRKMTLAHAEALKMDQARTAALAKSTAETVSLQATSKKTAETVSKMATVSSMAASAFGGLGGQAGGAAAALLGAFGAGGPVAIGIAAVGAAAAVTAGHFATVTENARKARNEYRALARELAGAAISETSQLEEQERFRGKSAEEISRMRAEDAAKEVVLAVNRANVARREIAESEARIRKLQADLDASTDPTMDRRDRAAATSALRARIEAERQVLEAAKGDLKEWEAAQLASQKLVTARITTADAERLEAQKKAADKSVEIVRSTNAKILREQEALLRAGREVAQMSEWDPALGQRGLGRVGPTAEDVERDRARRDREAELAGFTQRAIDVQRDVAKLSADAWQFEFSAAAGFLEGMSNAGFAAADAFSAAFDARSKGNIAQTVGGILSGVGAVLSVIPGLQPAGLLAGVGGGILSRLPFREGGAVRGYEIPKARGGAMVIGSGMDSDGRLIEAHSGEVVLSREGVARAGGMQAAARLNDPNASAPVNRGGQTTINVVALDPMTAVGVIQKSVEPAQTQRLRARAGAQYRKELQRAARGARSGGSL